MSVLARHVDTPQRRHRLVALDATRVRCLDCAHTLELRATTVPGETTSTSTSPPPLWADDRCQAHPGQRTSTCGACRAEQLERTTPVAPPQPTADVAAGAAAARAALAEIARRDTAEPADEQPDTTHPSAEAGLTWPCCTHCTGTDDDIGHPPHRLPCDQCTTHAADTADASHEGANA